MNNIFKNVLKIIGFFIIGMVGGIFANQIFWPYFIERSLFYQYRLEQRPIYLTERKEIFIQENVALENAIERVERSVIGIRTKTAAGRILEGSGLIVTSDGLVITLAELVPAGSSFSFFIEGKPVNFQILRRDIKNNLALIKLTDLQNLPTVRFEQFENIKLGKRVFLIGAIFNREEVKKVVNEGIITSFDENLIKTNILEKNILSSSLLFNVQGSFLGINIIDKEGRVSTIPISKIRTFTGL